MVARANTVVVGAVLLAASALAVALVDQCITEGFRQQILRALLMVKPHMVAMKPGSPPLAELDEAARKAEQVAGVQKATPLALAEAYLESRSTRRNAVLYGMDPGAIEQATELSKCLTTGTIECLGATTGDGRPGILLGLGLADELGIGVGDSVTVTHRRPDASGLTMQVCGTYRSGMYSEDIEGAFVSHPLVARVLGSPEDKGQLLQIRLHDPRTPPKTELARVLGTEFKLLDFRELNANLLSTLRAKEHLPLSWLSCVPGAMALLVPLAVRYTGRTRSVLGTTVLASVTVGFGLLLTAVGFVLLSIYPVPLDPKQYMIYSVQVAVPPRAAVGFPVSVWLIVFMGTLWARRT